MNKTKWIIFVLIVAAIIGGAIWTSKSNDKPFTGDPAKVITDGAIPDHTKGSKDNKVVVIEYGDFQCPGCAAMYQPMKALVAQYGEQVTFVFRNFPLTNIHPNALAAATAAEAAGKQGKFFEMHDVLYENQSAWQDVALDRRESVFTGYAKQIGLDEAKFKQDLKSKEISDKINRDRGIGGKIGVDSTPTFVIQGEKMNNRDNLDVELLTKKIREAITKAYPDAKLPEEPKPASGEQQQTQQ